MGKLVKNKTATVKTKSGRDYAYNYVDLATIDDYLDEQGLAYDQEVEIVTNQNGDLVGQFIMTQRYTKGEDGALTEWGKPKRGLPLDTSKDSDIQATGSRVTYLRRYSVAMAFGLAPADDDGQQAMPKKAERTTEVLDRPATDSQIKILRDNIDGEAVKSGLEYYKKSAITDLTLKEASLIIKKIRAMEQ